MTTSTTNSSINITLLLSVLCLRLSTMFVGGWHFQSSLVELQTQQQETTQIRSTATQRKIEEAK